MEQILLLGGDTRMAAAGEALRQDGFCVNCYWMPGHPLPGMEELPIETATLLVLPIPALTAEGNLYGVGLPQPPSWEELRQRLRPDCIVCGGNLQGVGWPHCVDFLQDDEFACANAVPTALAA